MKYKFPFTIQSQSQSKPIKKQRTTGQGTFWKKLPKPIATVSMVGSVTVLTIALSAIGVVAMSSCAALHVQLNPFELQLIKGSCNITSNLEKK